MLMVIFGAGASYDLISERTLQEHPYLRAKRLPLAKELFDNRFVNHFAQHRELQPLIPQLQEAAQNGNLEEELERLRVEQDDYPHLLARQFIGLRYYLREAIASASSEWQSHTSGVSSYGALLQAIEPWRHDHGEVVSLVTFNYDTLLEHAYSSLFGLAIHQMEAYTVSPRYKIFKVHGSTDWWREVGNIHGSPLESAEVLTLTETYVHVHALGVEPIPPVWSPPNREESGWIPAIAVPTVSKSRFECPPEMIAQLGAALPEVTHLLIIGWRGMEQHFLELWRSVAVRDGESSPPKLRCIQIVTTKADSAQAVYENIKREAGIRAPDVRCVGGGFTAYLANRAAALKDFLSA